MRLAHSYVDAADARAELVTLPSGAGELATHMSYAREAAATREAFLAAAGERWMVELREALVDLLARDRAVLTVGSGRGEHEVPLHRAGFDVLAPDLDAAQLRSLFATARRVTRPGGRVILVHRYRDTVATRAIDRVGLPAWAGARHLYHRARRLHVVNSATVYEFLPAA